MALSTRHVDALIDILENKLSDMYVWDVEDRKAATTLKSCLDELQTMKMQSRQVLVFESAQEYSQPASASAA